MLFCLSVDAIGRAILDDESHGDTLAVVEAKNWQEAREQAQKEPALNPFDYRSGWGWYRRNT